MVNDTNDAFNDKEHPGYAAVTFSCSGFDEADGLSCMPTFAFAKLSIVDGQIRS